MPKIIARTVELAKLQRLYESKKAEFLAIYGRRRIGKTFLISEYYKDKGVYFEITGTRHAPLAEQLRKYHQEFLKLFGQTQTTLSTPKTWEQALQQLVDAVGQIPTHKKVILFFDELPWLAGPRSDLVTQLDYYWNRHFSRMNNVILIICGSAAAWMIKHIIRNKGGLYGRLTEQIALQPFTLKEVKAYLEAQMVFLPNKQIVELYMVMGGVAKYLNFIGRGLSANQIIDQLFFTTQGSLLTEFNDIYLSLFDHAETHIKIVKALSEKRYGLSREALIQKIGAASGGKITTILKELEESGFILSFRKFNQKEKDKKIILIDEYSYFYLNFVDELKSEIIRGVNEAYWQKMQIQPRFSAWAGYAFESICCKHILEIKKALGLAGVSTTQAQWSYRPEKNMINKDNDEKGTEIDLLIDRADQCINICEIKFSKDEYVITKNYAQLLSEKKRIFREKTKTKKAIFITMITPYGVKKNEHYHAIVDNQLTLEDLFIA